MALKPDASWFPEGEKDPGYKAALKDCAARPEAWNEQGEGGTVAETQPAKKPFGSAKAATE